MDILGSIFDAIGDAFTPTRKRIHFTCYGVPYTAVLYLEGLGVRVWAGASPTINKDGSVDCTIQVRETQHPYAAGLLAGLSDVVVTKPLNIRPIKPRHRWGVPVKAGGGLNYFLRALAGGIDTGLPVVKKGKDKR